MMNAMKGDTGAIIQAECCEFIPKESVNVPPLLNPVRTQVNALSCLPSSLGDLVNQWSGSWGSWWKKLSLLWGITVLTSVFSSVSLPAFLLQYLPPV